METKTVENKQVQAAPERSAQAASNVRPRSTEESNTSSNKTNDAVNLRLAAENTENNQGTSKKSELSANIDNIKKQAEELRDDFENAFDFSATDVKFDVNLREPSRDMRFKVVERETGKTLREFPPESLSKASDLGVLDPGLLVNKSA